MLQQPSQKKRTKTVWETVLAQLLETEESWTVWEAVLAQLLETEESWTVCETVLVQLLFKNLRRGKPPSRNNKKGIISG